MSFKKFKAIPFGWFFFLYEKIISLLIYFFVIQNLIFASLTKFESNNIFSISVELLIEVGDNEAK